MHTILKLIRLFKSITSVFRCLLQIHVPWGGFMIYTINLLEIKQVVAE